MKKYLKAIVGFTVTFIGSLVTITQAGTPMGGKTVLLALGMAVVTSYGVYQVPNK